MNEPPRKGNTHHTISTGQSDVLRLESIHDGNPVRSPPQELSSTDETSGTTSIEAMAIMETEETSEVKYTTCHLLNLHVRRLLKIQLKLSGRRPVYIVLIIVAVTGLVIFIGLFPISFMRIEYYEIALRRSKLSGVLDRETIYYSGCYFLGPDAEFVIFPSTARAISRHISVSTQGTVTIEISFTLWYFIRPTEIGQLYSEFGTDYHGIIVNMVISTIRNLVSTGFTLDHFRFQRNYTELVMHQVLKSRLEGDCCDIPCKHINGSTLCNDGYHIDVRFFYLRSVIIPDEVLETYSQQAILKLETAKEALLQTHSGIRIETEVLINRLINEANEIRNQGYASSNKTMILSETDYEKVVQSAYASTMNSLYSLLNITQEDHKLSLLMFYSLRVMNNNLYSGYNYESSTSVKH